MSFFRTLFSQRLAELHQASPIESLVDAYLNNAPLDNSLVERAIVTEGADTYTSPWQLVQKWREVLALLLILNASNELHFHESILIRYVRQLKKIPLWREFQLLAIYDKLIAFLLGQPRPIGEITQLENGSCPLESGGHWAWGDIPHPIFHAELGIMWSLYGEITGETTYVKAAEKLADWQLNSLDHHFYPFVGLFSHEEDASKLSLLANNYVLFDALARIQGRNDYAYIADRLLAYIKNAPELEAYKIPFQIPLLEHWFSNHRTLVEKEIKPLKTNFGDPQLALVGFRSEKTSTVVTLFGGGTGIGCYHRGDVQIVSFGPQHLPLGDCRGFGLEGNSRLLSKHLKTLTYDDKGFLLEGLTRLTSRPKNSSSLSSFRQGTPGGVWMETKIDFKKDQLKIDASFIDIFDQPAIAFVFFVKANRCVVDKQNEIKLRSFKQYKGEVKPVELLGENSVVTIKAGSGHEEMQIIPLGGGENFWGADFLIAYRCPLKEKAFSWQIL